MLGEEDWGERCGRLFRRRALKHPTQTEWGFVFHPRTPSVKTLKVCLQSGHTSSLAWSAWGGGATEPSCWVFWRWKDNTADNDEDGRAFLSISLFSTRATTSFTTLLRISVFPRISRRLSGLYKPFRRTSWIM